MPENIGRRGRYPPAGVIEGSFRPSREYKLVGLSEGPRLPARSPHQGLWIFLITDVQGSWPRLLLGVREPKPADELESGFILDSLKPRIGRNITGNQTEMITRAVTSQPIG